MFNKFFPNLCVKVNKLWAKLTKNDEVIDVMEKGSVKVNPTLAGTEALITGIEVEGTKYKNVKVEANPTLAGTEAMLAGLEVNGTKYKNVAIEANPTLAGTEASLSGLEIDGTKYAIPSGGHLYMHNIELQGHHNIVIYNNVSTKYTDTQPIADYLYACGFDAGDMCYPITSGLTTTDTNSKLCIPRGLYATSGHGLKIRYGTALYNSTWSTGSYDSTTGLSNDIVTQIM